MLILGRLFFHIPALYMVLQQYCKSGNFRAKVNCFINSIFVVQCSCKLFNFFLNVKYKPGKAH